jgi:hypothetical protein
MILNKYLANALLNSHDKKYSSIRGGMESQNAREL